MAFLDGEARSADAIAFTDTDLFALSRKRFDALAERAQAARDQPVRRASRACWRSALRYTNSELRLLQLT